jgi:hypothetical protein
MKRKIIIIAFLFLLVIQTVNAADVIMSVDQSTYYFLTGQQAIIPLDLNNTYNKDINGQLKYTITQQINQGGSSYTSSNSQSTPFNVKNGNHTINLNFGSSNSPLKLDVDLIFSFDEKEIREVTLNDITIIFVSNQSQMENQKDRMESSSQKVTDAQPNNKKQNQQQTQQQKLQNNQMNQDSQALREQIQKQIQDQEIKKQEFEQNLFKNQDFMKNHSELIKQGYNITEKNINPESKDTGEFEIKYQNKKGEDATMSGSMKDGEIEELQKQTAEDRKQMMENLNQSKKFQNFSKQLKQEGYNQSTLTFNQHGNQTDLEIIYENKKNDTATIKARFENNELKEVSLEKEDKINLLIWLLPLIIIISIITLYVLYKKFFIKKQIKEFENILDKKPFNYKIEADKLLKEAEKLFKQKKYKDAYGKAGQSLRLYLSYKNGLNKEITNDDVIKYLRQNKKSFKDFKKCFDLCSLVEFAKFKEDINDFKNILKITGNTIKS